MKNKKATKTFLIEAIDASQDKRVIFLAEENRAKTTDRETTIIVLVLRKILTAATIIKDHNQAENLAVNG